MLRECTDAVNLEGTRGQTFFNHVVKDYKLVLLMGLPLTGKSYYMKNYEPHPGWDYSYWNKEPILTMLNRRGNIDPTFYNHINQLENSVFPKVLEQDFQQLIYEGYGRMLSFRRKLLSYQEGVKSCCLVFDGPKNLIVERGVLQGLSRSEFDLDLEKMIMSVQWPKFSEGWSSIYYCNSFGKDGLDYFLKSCHARGY